MNAGPALPSALMAVSTHWAASRVAVRTPWCWVPMDAPVQGSLPSPRQVPASSVWRVGVGHWWGGPGPWSRGRHPCILLCPSSGGRRREACPELGGCRPPWASGETGAGERLGEAWVPVFLGPCPCPEVPLSFVVGHAGWGLGSSGAARAS